MISLHGSTARWLPARSRVAGIRKVARGFSLDRQIDFWLRELDPTWSLTQILARVVGVVEETHDVKTFILVPNRRWPGHRAGQFVTVEIEVDGVRMTRCYSLSSVPADFRIAITVKRVVGGRVSSFLHDHVQPGDVLRLGAPAGDFVLPVPFPSKLLLLSGGSGITPVMCILRDLVIRDTVQDVVFVHAARSARDVIFREELERLARRHRGLRLLTVLEDGSSALGGRLDAHKLHAAVPDLALRDTFLCGPPGMMHALSPIWHDAGLSHRLKIERFVAPPVAPPATGSTPAQLRVNLARSGKTLTTQDTGTLLEELERAGERPMYGCRMGICDTCRCQKRAGIVEDINTGALSTAGEEPIRLCVSRARTDLELIL